MCNLNETVFHFINMHWKQEGGGTPCRLSQDTVKARLNLIRADFKVQFRMSIKTSVNYLM